MKLHKVLLILSIIALLTLTLPNIALAEIVEFNTINTEVFTQSTIDITPQKRQQMQAMRQRRNKDIQAVLDSSQQVKLVQSLRNGDDLNQALDKLELQPEQRDMVKAISQLYNLKLKTVTAKPDQF
jgi:Spy/CpxP family protein refolding chaperone